MAGTSDRAVFGNTVVIGATGGIGAAMSDCLSERGAEVQRLGRNTLPAIDVTEEASIAAAAATLEPGGPYDLIFIATGALAADAAGPEKNLRQLEQGRLLELMALNAIGPVLVAKHFHHLLPRNGRSVLAVLSARVGSIDDNRLGGWYGYRASKAALNQYWRTAAIEISRKRRDAVVLALHPGTVKTPLSAGFTDGRDTFTPAESARRMLDVMESATPRDSGAFLDYHGRHIPF